MIKLFNYFFIDNINCWVKSCRYFILIHHFLIFFFSLFYFKPFDKSRLFIPHDNNIEYFSSSVVVEVSSLIIIIEYLYTVSVETILSVLLKNLKHVSGSSLMFWI